MLWPWFVVMLFWSGLAAKFCEGVGALDAAMGCWFVFGLTLLASAIYFTYLFLVWTQAWGFVPQ